MIEAAKIIFLVLFMGNFGANVPINFIRSIFNHEDCGLLTPLEPGFRTAPKMQRKEKG